MNAEAVLKKAEVLRLSSRLLTQGREKVIELLLLLAALTSVAITVGIVGVLIYESIGFFQQVSLLNFLTDRQWTPLFCRAALWHSVSGFRHRRHHGGCARSRDSHGQFDRHLSE